MRVDNEMVERVARALMAADPYLDGCYDEMARAAIEAYEAHLRETGMVIVPRAPTEAMCAATYRDHAGRPCSGRDETMRLTRDHLWPTMIDEALK